MLYWKATLHGQVCSNTSALGHPTSIHVLTVFIDLPPSPFTMPRLYILVQVTSIYLPLHSQCQDMPRLNILVQVTQSRFQKDVPFQSQSLSPRKNPKKSRHTWGVAHYVGLCQSHMGLSENRVYSQL